MTEMDTKAINSQLERLDEDENCVLISTKMYHTINSIQKEFPGLKLLHKPLSIIHPTYLNLLTSNGIEIVCPNMEVLGGMKKVGAVSSDLPTQELIRASSGLGCSLYQYNDVTTSRTIAALCPEAELDLVVTGEGEGFTELLRDAALPVTGLTIDREIGSAEDVCLIGQLIHTLLEIATQYNHAISTVSVGLLTSNSNHVVHRAIQALTESLPPHLTPGLTLTQDLFTRSLMLAARVLDREEEEEGKVSYVVDLSMYNELAMYLDRNTIYTDGTRAGVIRGNSYDEDDVIIAGLVPDVRDWIILKGVALADFREFNLYLLHSEEERIVQIKEEVASDVTDCHYSPDNTLYTDAPSATLVM